MSAAGFAAVMAQLSPSASVTVDGSSTQVAVNGTGGNITIASNAIATVNSTPTLGTTILNNATNPGAAGIALSDVNSSAVTDVGSGAMVHAGTGTGTLSITSNNLTTVTTTVDGSGAVAGVTGAVTLDNSVSQASVNGGSAVTGGTVDVLATTTNTANTTALATASGGSASSAIQNILAGKVDPNYLLSGIASATPDNSSPAATAENGGVPVAVAGSVAVTKFTPTTQALVDSSTVTATNAINIGASANNNTQTVSNASSATSTGSVGVGVGVAVSDVVASNTASLESTTGATSLSAPTINVQAAIPGMSGPSSATPNILSDSVSATAGASGSEVGRRRRVGHQHCIQYQ